MTTASDLVAGSKVDRGAGQDRRCALLAAAQLMSNANLLKMSATPATNARKVAEAAEVLLGWLEDR